MTPRVEGYGGQAGSAHQRGIDLPPAPPGAPRFNPDDLPRTTRVDHDHPWLTEHGAVGRRRRVLRYGSLFSGYGLAFREPGWES